MTTAQATALVAKALSTGKPLTVQCPNGDVLTAGRRHDGWFCALRWGRSRWAEPCGREVASDPLAGFLAHAVVEHCGRGNAAAAARKVL